MRNGSLARFRAVAVQPATSPKKSRRHTDFGSRAVEPGESCPPPSLDGSRRQEAAWEGSFAFGLRIQQKESFMNDVPPAKRSDTQSPFAVLSSELGRGQTGTRVKITEAESTEPEAGSFSPAVPPESLKKPFSSLLPNKPPATAKQVASLMPTLQGNAPPPPPSQLFAETASVARTTTSTGPGRTSIAPRREGAAPNRYGTCKEHGTALTSEGKCVLCAREKAKKDAKRNSRALVLLALVLLGAAAYFVLEMLPK